jgi:predicted dithiol-disulfide oxidoreductase (DUF899 family)
MAWVHPLTKRSKSSKELGAVEKEIARLEKKAAKLRAKTGGSSVADYELHGWDGPTRLSALFDGKDELIVVHNMGAGCDHCSMWADGFNGVLPHIRERAAFVVASHDPVEAQKKIAAKRGWQFKMVTAAGSTLFKDLGFADKTGLYPGASTFRRTKTGKIKNVASTMFGPGDRFCSVWSFFDMLPAPRRAAET